MHQQDVMAQRPGGTTPEQSPKSPLKFFLYVFVIPLAIIILLVAIFNARG